MILSFYVFLRMVNSCQRKGEGWMRISLISRGWNGSVNKTVAQNKNQSSFFDLLLL